MTGTLHVIGLGPGDPELVTVRAARLLGGLRVVAHCAARDRPGHAKGIAAPYLHTDVREMRFDYPVTTELAHDHPGYVAAMTHFYDDAAGSIGQVLRGGHDVGLLCEGDPFFYGSAMYLFDRLRADHAVTVTPGITGMAGSAAAAALPLTHGDDVLTVLPGTLGQDALADHLHRTDAAVMMKLGRNLPKVRAALTQAGLLERAVYVERGTMAAQRIMPLAEMQGAAPYFSLLLVPGRQGVR